MGERFGGESHYLLFTIIVVNYVSFTGQYDELRAVKQSSTTEQLCHIIQLFFKSSS